MNTPKKKPMVGWYDPRQLINTGIQVLVSDLIGTRFDIRREEAITARQDESPHDYSQTAADFWFDFMADTGDGWESTFHMAKVVSQPVEVGGLTLPRGRFLILGGDEIYPYASKQEYQDRLIAPLNAAAREAGEVETDLYAIPGNHDWYDGLISFLRQFTQGRRIGDWQTPDGRVVGGWQTRQARSYFALKLPQRWWLWAVDTQLEADLDQPQVDYFRGIVGQMGRGDRLIVCIPEPDWLYGKMRKDPTLMNNMAYLLDHVIGDKVKVYLTLSGDLHHYRRHQHQSDPTQQKIVAGGGGAFLHPTHRHDVSSVDVYGQTFVLQDSQFPGESTSFWLTFRNLIFPALNPWFGTLTAPIYLLFAWHLARVEWSINGLFEMTVSQPTVTLALIAVTLLGFFYFSVGNRLFRFFWGTLAHGGAHVAAVLFLADTMSRWFGTDLSDWRTAFPRLIGLLAGGYLFGSVIMGLYLLTSLNIFGTHHNEAFSALRISHYKNFLRLRICADGRLEIYPIGVPHLKKPPILIESPINIVPPA